MNRGFRCVFLVTENKRRAFENACWMGRYLIYLLALQIVEWLKYRIPRQQPIKICQTVVSEISLALASGCMSTKDIITHVS